LFWLLFISASLRPFLPAQETGAELRKQLVEAVSIDDDEQPARIEALAGTGSDLAAKVLAAWRGGELFKDKAADGTGTLFYKEAGAAIRLDNGEAFTPTEAKEVETSSKIRKAIKNATERSISSNRLPQKNI
jgi:hypothetical protein